VENQIRTAGPRKWVLAVAMTIASSVLALSATSALAAATGPYEVFKNCPLSNPEVVACTYATTTSGEFIVGNKTVPIKHTVTLQGGLATENGTTFTFVAPTNGTEILSKTPQTVPGGLIGIEGLGGEVTATAELAGPASSVSLQPINLVSASGTALTLPVKLKLGNPFLGNHCYAGSNAHPIVINLTTGTTSPPPPNKPISGKPGTVEEEEGIVTLNNNTLANNSFAAPGVEGCGLIPFLVDPVVDLVLGVPAGEGHNTAVLNGALKVVPAELVRNH
jgi:hypothetical protein